MPYEFVKIDFDKILPDVLEMAVGEHVAGPNYARGWAPLVKQSEALNQISIGLAKQHGFDPLAVRAFIAIGINIGYLLHERQSERRIDIVNFS